MLILAAQIPAAAIPAEQIARAGDMDRVSIIIMVVAILQAVQRKAHIQLRL
jgi:hypothetical protein